MHGSGTALHGKVFYLNIMVLQKTEELDNLVKEKVGAKMPNPFGHGLLGKAAGKVVTKILTEDKLAAKFATKIPETIPLKMQEMGITAESNLVFQKGSFVVVRMEVEHVDVTKLLNVKAGASKAKKVGGWLACGLGIAGLCCSHADEQLDRKLVEKIHTTLIKKLPESLPEKMATKGIKVDVVGKDFPDEAGYLKSILPGLFPGGNIDVDALLKGQVDGRCCASR